MNGTPFFELAGVEEREPVNGCRVKFLHTANLTMAYWQLAPGAEIPPHSHPHEQVASVIEGSFRMTVGERTQIMQEGHVALIAPGTEHTGRALTACRIIDVFYPPREDYR